MEALEKAWILLASDCDYLVKETWKLPLQGFMDDHRVLLAFFLAGSSLSSLTIHQTALSCSLLGSM